MGKYVPAQYGVCMGGCGGSSMIDEDLWLNDEEAAVYDRALAAGEDLNEVKALKSAMARYEEEMKDIQIDSLIEEEDEYTLTLMGLGPLDPSEINQMVRERDPRALAYFGLEDLDEEELDEWDAWDHEEEMPLPGDFYDDFTPKSPFEGYGYTLLGRFIDPREQDRPGRRE